VHNFNIPIALRPIRLRDPTAKDNPMVVIGLTGSLAMGKSTVAQFFAETGVPVHDADLAVHQLYASGAASQIEAAFPGTINSQGVDRVALAKRVLGDDAALRRLEAIVHPMVRRHEEQFLEMAERSGAGVAVLDIPLLFETGSDRRVDAVIVVTAPADMQRERALGRSGMTEDKFRALLAKQMPDAEKRRRADFIVDTSGSFDSTRAQVHAILQAAPRLAIRRGRSLPPSD
jgi:dephospho-CoA kinase